MTTSRHRRRAAGHPDPVNQRPTAGHREARDRGAIIFCDRGVADALFGEPRLARAKPGGAAGAVAARTSDSTRRFWSRAEIEGSLRSAGYALAGVRDAPDRPGWEWVFIARKP
jgi:hypothetical protein